MKNQKAEVVAQQLTELVQTIAPKVRSIAGQAYYKIEIKDKGDGLEVAIDVDYKGLTDEMVEGLESDYYRNNLESCDWDYKATAKRIGISEEDMLDKIIAYRLFKYNKGTIRKALKSANGDISKAAELLGITTEYLQAGLVIRNII